MPTEKFMLQVALGLLVNSLLSFGVTPWTIAEPTRAHVKDAKLDSTTQELILNQEQRDSGSYVTSVTRNAVKMVNVKNGIVLIAKAPHWEVHFFRPSDKIIWVGPMEKVSPAMMVNPFKDKTTMQVQPTILANSHLDRLTDKKEQVIYKDGEGSLQGLHYAKYSNFGPGKKIVFFAADQFPIDPKCAEVLCRMCRNPFVDQIPLYVLGSKPGQKEQSNKLGSNRKNANFVISDLYNSKYDVRTGPQEYLVTKSWKAVPFNSNDFAFPLNYKRVSEFTDVYFSQNIKSQLTSVIDGMGFVSSDNDNNHKGHTKNAPGPVRGQN